MARFILVHGAFSGAWIWGPLQELLKAAGHTSIAFDLPGLGDDKTLARDVTLDSSADRVCESLAASPGPAIVVGHSMGGVVITQAAARCRDRIAALVYVAAFLPKDGQSLLDLTHLPEGAGDQVQANIVVNEDLAEAVMPAAASKDALYGCCTDEVAAWATARQRQRPQPLAPFATPVSIPAGSLDRIPKYYVLCSRDRAIPPPLQRRMIAENAENKCAGVFELDTDHTPHLSKPTDISQLFERIAARI